MFKPIDFFIHPLPIAAVLLTGLNDHWLKLQYPGVITGKLSDFTGLFYFPLFVATLVILLVQFFKKDFLLNRGLLLAAIATTDIVFCVLKLNPTANDFFVQFFSRHFFAIKITLDATDLIALSSSFACYFFARKFIVA